MIFKVKIILIDQECENNKKDKDKKKLVLIDNVFHFNINKEDAYVANSLALSIISTLSGYADNEFCVLTDGLNKEFLLRLVFQLELYNTLREDENRFIISYSGSKIEKSIKLEIIKDIFADYYHAVRRPSNEMHCDALALRFREAIHKHGLVHDTKIKEILLDENSDLQAIYAVGKASMYQPRLFVVEFGKGKGANADEYDVAICGKGVCYDTGGLSLKPTSGMVDMNKDMGGSALGFYASLCYYLIFKAPLLCVLGIVENSIGSNAYRPGDIIGSYSGKKIFIGNTDAEGRVVLADVIAYASKNYKVGHIVTLATLTGAAMLVCGEDYCPYVSFCNEKIHGIISAVKKRTAEYLVALPSESKFVKSYIDRAPERYADISNITKTRCEGSHGPAHFLHYFVNKELHTHFDIANYFDSEICKGRCSSSDLLEFMVEFISEIKQNSETLKA